MDNFNTLWNRLLNRAPNIGPVLAQQFINDSWHTLQAMEEWSWRRRSSTFAPPNQYITGLASTNVATGSPNLITGVGTVWTPSMIGQQIRIGGLLYPFYTIVGWLSATSILIDQPWAGPDVASQTYQILQCYFPVPSDFGYFYVAVSVKDAYRLYTDITEAELALLDPQRNQQGQTYAIAFKDFTSQFGGIVGPVIPLSSPSDPAPISTTSTGYSYVANATYFIQIINGGASGTATFQWIRAGQLAYQPAQTTSDQAQTLSDGVQIYWPDGINYIAGHLFVINCQSIVTASVPRYELWPAPTFSGYLYPYIYIAKEYDLTVDQPALPPFVANRGEILLEMALEKCAEWPGSDADHPSIYFNLPLAQRHASKVADMLIEFKNSDQNVGITNIGYQNMSFGGPFAGPYGVWLDGAYQQNHSPWL